MGTSMIVERDEHGTRMIFSGAFSAEWSATIKQYLSESMMRSGHETLVLTNVTSIDILGIKLAYTWRRALELQDRTGKIVLPECAVIRDLLVRTGIAELL